MVLPYNRKRRDKQRGCGKEVRPVVLIMRVGLQLEVVRGRKKRESYREGVNNFS